MKNIYILIVLFSLCSCFNKKRVTLLPEKEIEHRWLWEWIQSWDKISEETFNLPETTPPKILFYDEQYVYSNSQVSSPNGMIFEGPDLYNQKITWRKQLHNNTLILPDSIKVPLQLMTFAAPLENGSYFIMPAPSYWKKVGLKNEVVSVDQMLNGIFVHEFAHTRQLESIIKNIIEFEQNENYDHPVNDDIVQNYFQKDSTYRLTFKQEINCFYELLNINKEKSLANYTKICLDKFKLRQKTYLLPISVNLIEMDNVFLTMEGIGQYAMMSYYMSADGGNLSFEEALKATRHNKKWWSQEEGLALLLVYEKLVGKIDWSELFIMKDTTIVELLENKL